LLIDKNTTIFSAFSPITQIKYYGNCEYFASYFKKGNPFFTATIFELSFISSIMSNQSAVKQYRNYYFIMEWSCPKEEKVTF